MARAILFLLFLVLVFHYVNAQPVRKPVAGALTGIVIDSSGAAMPGAAVRVLGTRQGGLAKAPHGRFCIAGILAGDYSIAVSYRGSDTVCLQVRIEAGETTDVDTIVLPTARTRQRSCVCGEPAPRERIDASARNDLYSAVAMYGSVTTSPINGFSIRGGRAKSTTILVDGLSVSDPFAGGFTRTPSQVYPTVNSLAVQEVQIVPSGFSAEYGDILGCFGSTSSPPDAFIAERVQSVAAPEALLTITPYADRSGERYETIYENPFIASLSQRFSTFSIDVDAASYALVRSYVQAGQSVPPDAVRIEELINYFDYDYPEPNDEHPFGLITEVSECPWNREHKLVQVAIQGRRLDVATLPPANLVFLIDVSGSMDEPNKLPLVQNAFRLLVEQLRPQDRVAIVVYAGAAGLVLPTTSGAERTAILGAIDQLRAGGSTAGGDGLVLAYETARKSFLPDGNNRVILATDGDFNVGVSDDDALVELIESKRDEGVFLSVLGFGTGNYQDAKMEKLADKGNGNYAYVDNISEARKVFVSQLGGTLFAIARDVKIQLEFDPSRIREYRLIGYENRLLAREDFEDDTKDAGELGAGHAVTALYEIVPVGAAMSGEWRGRPDTLDMPGTDGDGLMQVRLRYKLPNGTTSQLIEAAAVDRALRLSQTSDNFRFAAAVAEFGLLLRDSRHKGSASYDEVLRLAESARTHDPNGYRAEFIDLVRKAASSSATAR